MDSFRGAGPICRVEVDPRDIKKMLDPEIRNIVVRDIKAAGYEHVVLDLAGYVDPNEAHKSH